MKIGVFDSGVGGQSFVDALKSRFIDAEIVYKEDKDNIPYGNKSPEELLRLTLPIFKSFESEGCSAVLVACNTVTTTIINELRNALKIPLVGVEPMVKPAAEKTKTKNIAVCATPTTLKSARYAWLKQNFGQGINIYEPDCSIWATMIEQNRSSELKLSELITEMRQKNVDIIVLGCTHYHWIESELKQITEPDIQVIQPIEPVINQLERILKDG